MLIHRFPFYAPEPDATAGGGGGDAAAKAAADAAAAKPGDKPADPAAAIAALTAQLATLTAERDAEKASAAKAISDAAAAAEAKAKAEADAKLTDAQKAQAAKDAELEGLKGRVATMEAEAMAAARNGLLDQLGADPAYRQVFPQGDARDAKVKSAIEKFAADHPRLLTRQAGPPRPDVPDLKTLLKGKPISSLADPRAMAASYQALAEIRGR